VVDFFSPKLVINSSKRTGGEKEEEEAAPHIRTLEARKLLFSLNSMLPKSIRCLWVSPVPETFHVIQDVVMKQYNYYLSFNSVDPFTAHARLQISDTKSYTPVHFDLESFKAGAKLMEGTHDFAAFSNKPGDDSARESVREVVGCNVFQDQHGIYLQVKGKGFLYKQVRHMVGALLWVAEGKLPLESIAEALREGYLFVESGKRKWRPAPAVGLHLMFVRYSELDNGLVIPMPHEAYQWTLRS
jgi:tRNA pseudouridine38-40 synthase